MRESCTTFVHRRLGQRFSGLIDLHAVDALICRLPVGIIDLLASIGRRSRGDSADNLEEKSVWMLNAGVRRRMKILLQLLREHP